MFNFNIFLILFFIVFIIEYGSCLGVILIGLFVVVFILWFNILVELGMLVNIIVYLCKIFWMCFCWFFWRLVLVLILRYDLLFGKLKYLIGCLLLIVLVVINERRFLFFGLCFIYCFKRLMWNVLFFLFMLIL